MDGSSTRSSNLKSEYMAAAQSTVMMIAFSQRSRSTTTCHPSMNTSVAMKKSYPFEQTGIDTGGHKCQTQLHPRTRQGGGRYLTDRDRGIFIFSSLRWRLEQSGL